VQVSWIGYPGTTGTSSIDYYIGDKHFLPQDLFASQFSEKLAYIPSTAPYTPFSFASDIELPPCLKRGRLTFGSFNRPGKIHREVIALWAKVLKAVPNSCMLVAGISDQYQIHVLTTWFEGEDIDRERLSFHRRSSVEPYLQLHHDVDICLDTFPYTGGTTTRHALWMGVPTITIAGATPAGRQASSIMELMGLGDFVASSMDEFVSLAQNWAGRQDELAEIRMDMRNRFARSPLGKHELIASAFVKAARIMWQRWCAGEPTDVIDVSAYEADALVGSNAR
jgi:predicted O-linked N-acetylglucosamine transferase (SPINDLY family)